MAWGALLAGLGKGGILLPTLCTPAARGALGRHCGCCCSSASPHRSVCINTHLHCYHSPVTVTVTLPSPRWTRGALGTPSSSLPRSVPRGAAWAGERVCGRRCHSRWSVGPDQGTARTEGCPRGGGAFTEAGCEWRPRGPITHLLVPGAAAASEPGRLRLAEGWGEETEPTAASCSQQGGAPGGYQRGREVLPVLLSPPELPETIIYTYICITE